VQLVPDLGQPELHLRMPGPEAAHQVGYQPGAERLLEGDRDRAGLRRHELADGGDPVVEAAQHRVDVRLEHLPGPGQPQRPARPAEQRGADLGLQPGQRPGYARLGDPVVF